MKRTICSSAAIVLAAILLASCGYKAPTSGYTAPVSTLLTKRAFVTNEFANIVQLVDASTDTLNSFTLATGGSPQTMVVSGDKKTTLVFNAAGNTVSVVNNPTEAVTKAANLTAYSDSLAISADGKAAYAALRNAASSTGTPLGVVSFIDLSVTTPTVTSVDVPLARRLVLGPNGAKLLVFSDNSDSVTVIDTATKVATAVGGFDRPAWGVFSSDSSTAFIMNCGPECGGTTAGVAQLDMTLNTITTTVPVSAATTGLLDGTNLYVAGTVSAGAGGGCLEVLTTSGLALTKPCVAINDGYHTTMALSSGHLFVGARACSNVAEGCLSVYDTGAGTAAIDTPKGEVTGMQAISGRTRVYVCEGGELRIYDSSTGNEILPPPVDIVGKAWDVKTLD